MGRDSREVWAQRVARWRDSDLTAQEFASETGINARTLAYWSWRLGVKAKATAKRAKAPPKREPPSPALHFVELTATPPPGEAAAPATPPPQTSGVGGGLLELVLPRGLCIRVPVGFDAATLRRLVDALEAR